MRRSWTFLIGIAILAGCASTAPLPPPDVEIRAANLPSVTDVVGPEKSDEAFVRARQNVAVQAANLSTAARNVRQRELMRIEAVSAQTPERRAVALMNVLEEEKKGNENEKKLEDLLGVGFGIGATITFNVHADRVESAELFGDEKIVRVTKDKNIVPRMLMEAHYLFTTNPFGGVYKASNGEQYTAARAQRERCKANEDDCPTIAAGPFIGFQQTADGSSFNALAIGIAMGFHPTRKAGVAIGVGAMFDSSAKVLGEGITPGKPLPNGETAVRFKETSQVNPILSVSFTF